MIVTEIETGVGLGTGSGTRNGSGREEAGETAACHLAETGAIAAAAAVEAGAAVDERQPPTELEDGGGKRGFKKHDTRICFALCLICTK